MDIKESYDVVVIGSGFGGAITACRLAQAGKSVCILEKGRRWKHTDFPRASGQVAEWAIYDQKQKGKEKNGFVEYVTFPGMDVVQGVGVGGGSLHYFNVHIQPPDFIMESEKWPKAVTLETMQPYYKVAADMLKANPISPPDGREMPPRTVAFKEAADKASGGNAELVPICVHFDGNNKTSSGGLPQQNCVYCGDCLLGCHVQSKNTLDVNYIPIAEQNGAEVYPEHTVTKIIPLSEEGYEVEFQAGSKTSKVKGTQVVLGAGTLGTNELLLRCKHEHKTLPNISDQLGKGYSGNGDFIFAGAYVEDKVIDPGVGPSITAGVGFAKSKEKQNIYIEDLGYPNEFLWYLNAKLPKPRQIVTIIREVFDYLATKIRSRFNKEPDFELRKFFNPGYLGHFLPYLGMGTDAADGELQLKKDKFHLKWSNKNSRAMFNDMIKHMKDISEAAGGKFINSFLYKNPLNFLNLPFLNLDKTLTAHPLGGCNLSDSPEQGVTDNKGEVWGYKGLYVADGAIVPSAISVNPSATISALAERVAFNMIHGRELQPDDPDTPSNLAPGAIEVKPVE